MKIVPTKSLLLMMFFSDSDSETTISHYKGAKITKKSRESRLLSQRRTKKSQRTALLPSKTQLNNRYP